MEASCGPSNGLKSLQRHFNQDRSLHQSRFSSTSDTSGQTFRASHHHQGQQDQADRDQADFLRGATTNHTTRGDVYHDGHGWAQEYNMSRPQYTHQHAQTPLQGPTTAAAMPAWGQDFMAFQAQAQAQAQVQTQVQASSPQVFGLSRMMNPQVGVPVSFTHQMNDSQHRNREAATTATATAAAFNQAFEEADAALHAFNIDAQQDAYGPPFIIPDDAIPSTRDVDFTRDGGDALAGTAAELISRLRDEQSEKFKNSQFMALMHQLKDHQVVLQDDKLVHADSGIDINTHSNMTLPDTTGLNNLGHDDDLRYSD